MKFTCKINTTHTYLPKHTVIMSKSNPSSAKKSKLSPPDKGILNGRAHRSFLRAITHALNKEYNDPEAQPPLSQLWHAWKHQGVENATYAKLCLIVGEEPDVKLSHHEITNLIIAKFPILPHILFFSSLSLSTYPVIFDHDSD